MLRRLAFSFLVYVPGLLGAEHPPKPEAATPVGEPATFALQDMLDTKEQNVNGVVLRIEGRHERNERGDRIQVRWSIDYDGPRWPFTILEPTLTRPTGGQTRLLVLATGKNGKAYARMVNSPSDKPLKSPWEPGQSKPSWFATKKAAGEKPLEGTLYVSVAELKRFFIKALPNQFDEDEPPALHLRLRHDPIDRGEQYDLDAWTGYLIYSTTVEVKLTKW